MFLLHSVYYFSSLQLSYYVPHIIFKHVIRDVIIHNCTYMVFLGNRKSSAFPIIYYIVYLIHWRYGFLALRSFTVSATHLGTSVIPIYVQITYDYRRVVGSQRQSIISASQSKHDLQSHRRRTHDTPGWRTR